jgi:hypothetical protein
MSLEGDDTKGHGVPVEGQIGIITRFVNNAFDKVVGGAQTPMHASVIADTLQKQDTTAGVEYRVDTVKFYAEEAI